MVWHGLTNAAEWTHKILKAMFGWVGSVFYWTGFAVVWLVTYVPIKIWEILGEMGNVIGRGMHEVVVWVNPKAA